MRKKLRGTPLAWLLKAALVPAALLWPHGVTAQVPDSMDVDILTRPVSRGTLLTATDFTRSEADAGDARFALTAQRVKGMAARRDLPRGSIVRAADVAPPPAVRRGEPVRIMLDMAGMLITAQGRALADAAEGEPVRVYSTSTNATLTARVTAPGAVALRIN